MAQIEYNVEDLFEQGIKNIFEEIYKNQFDPKKYPKKLMKNTYEEIKAFLDKLCILSPIEETHNGETCFKILSIIEDGVYSLNIEKLEKLGINVYMTEDQEYYIRIVNKQIGEKFYYTLCPPDEYFIARCVMNAIYGDRWWPKGRQAKKGLTETIQKLIME